MSWCEIISQFQKGFEVFNIRTTACILDSLWIRRRKRGNKGAEEGNHPTTFCKCRHTYLLVFNTLVQMKIRFMYKVYEHLHTYIFVV